MLSGHGDQTKRRQNFYNQQKHFSSFVLLVDEMMGKEAQVVLVTFSQIMAVKMDGPILHKGWIDGRIAIAIARSYSRVIHQYRLPITLQTQEPDWALGSVLVLAQ